MYERLIQKLINRNVGAIAGTLRPTGGTTYCTVETGLFSYTYDGSTTTGACFKKNQNCLSEWYWTDPVNVTKFNIRSHYYYPNSIIRAIWGRVNGSWVQVWGYADWKPKHAAWDSKTISCNNCTGIRISQKHAVQPSRPCITEVTVDYETVEKPTAVIHQPSDGATVTSPVYFRGEGKPTETFLQLMWYDGNKLIHYDRDASASAFYYDLSPGVHNISFIVLSDTRGWSEYARITITVIAAEGKADIVSIYKPDKFTPGVEFHIKPKVKNVGETDTLFMGLTDTDTGKVLKDPDIYTFYTAKGTIWEQDWVVTLVQKTDFHGKIQVGHKE